MLGQTPLRWTSSYCTDFTPVCKVVFFKKPSLLATGFTFWSHLNNWRIYDLDIEKAVFKLNSMEYAQLITFHSEAFTWFFLMDVYKRQKGTRAGTCSPDIWWVTYWKGYSWLMLNGTRTEMNSKKWRGAMAHGCYLGQKANNVREGLAGYLYNKSCKR